MIFVQVGSEHEFDRTYYTCFIYKIMHENIHNDIKLVKVLKSR